MAESDVIEVRGKWYSRTTRRYLGDVEEGKPRPSSSLSGEPVKTLDEMSKQELVAVAKEEELEGYSTMNKDDLLAALKGETVESEEEAEDEGDEVPSE